MWVQSVVLVAVFAGLCHEAAIGAGPQRSRDTAVIAGQVVDAVSGAPIEGASVYLWNAPVDPVASLAQELDPSKRPTPRVLATDRDGRFLFTDVAAGQYVASVRADGYVTSAIGDRRASPDFFLAVIPGIEVRAGERVDNLLTKVWPTGSIEGTVLDEHGDPLVKGAVRLFREDYIGGRRTWSAARLARTDDRGMFRIANLWPVSYLVALEADATAQRQRSVFYAGSLTVEGATPVVLRPGEQRLGLQLVYDAASVRAAPLTVSGRVSGRNSGDERPLVVHLIPQTASGATAALEELTAVADSSGTFTFRNVPPGMYRLAAWQFPVVPQATPLADLPPLPQARTLAAEVSLSLDRPVENAQLVLQPAAQVSGRVAFQNGQPRSELLRRVSVLIRPADGAELRGIPAGRIEADGTFRSVGLPPGAYSIHVDMYQARVPELMAWTLASARVRGREVAGGSFVIGTADLKDVQLTMAAARTVSGTVRDRRGQAVPYASVIVFPVERERWRDFPAFLFVRRIQRLMTDRRGMFETTTFPGEYLVAVVPEPPQFWMSPDFLESLSATSAKFVVPQSGRVFVDVTSK